MDSSPAKTLRRIIVALALAAAVMVVLFLIWPSSLLVRRTDDNTPTTNRVVRSAKNPVGNIADGSNEKSSPPANYRSYPDPANPAQTDWRGTVFITWEAAVYGLEQDPFLKLSAGAIVGTGEFNIENCRNPGTLTIHNVALPFEFQSIEVVVQFSYVSRPSLKPWYYRFRVPINRSANTAEAHILFPSAQVHFDLSVPESNGTVASIFVSSEQFFIGAIRTGVLYAPPSDDATSIYAEVQDPSRPWIEYDVRPSKAGGDDYCYELESLTQNQLTNAAFVASSRDICAHLEIKGIDFRSLPLGVSAALIREREDTQKPGLRVLEWSVGGQGVPANRVAARALVLRRHELPQLSAYLDDAGRFLFRVPNPDDLPSNSGSPERLRQTLLVVWSDGRSMVLPPPARELRNGEVVVLEAPTSIPVSPTVVISGPPNWDPNSACLIVGVSIPGERAETLRIPSDRYYWVDAFKVEGSGKVLLSGLPANALWWPLGVCKSDWFDGATHALNTLSNEGGLVLSIQSRNDIIRAYTNRRRENCPDQRFSTNLFGFLHPMPPDAFDSTVSFSLILETSK